MAINGISSGASLYNTSAISTRINEAGQQSLARIEKSAESTRVQLSSLGQIKAATAEVQSSAKTLQDSSKLTSFDAVKKAAQAFASAVSTQQSTVAQAVQTGSNLKSGASEGVLATQAGVRNAASDVRRALQGSNNANASALSQLGFSVEQNGTVKLDAKKLEAAYQADPQQVTATLAKIGQGVEAAASKQLSDTGNVGASLNRLNTRLDSLTQQQSSQQTRLQDMQNALDQRNAQVEQARRQTQQAFGFTGIVAYQGVFSF